MMDTKVQSFIQVIEFTLENVDDNEPCAFDVSHLTLKQIFEVYNHVNKRFVVTYDGKYIIIQIPSEENKTDVLKKLWNTMHSSRNSLHKESQTPSNVLLKLLHIVP